MSQRVRVLMDGYVLWVLMDIQLRQNVLQKVMIAMVYLIWEREVGVSYHIDLTDENVMIRGRKIRIWLLYGIIKDRSTWVQCRGECFSMRNLIIASENEIGYDKQFKMMNDAH